MTALPEGCASDREVQALKNQVATTPPGQWATYSGSQVIPMLRRLLKRLDHAETLVKATLPAARSEPAAEMGACTDCGDTGITFQTERRCACQPRRDAAIGAVAALAAAISLLERTPRAKKAAPSDRMFDQMLADYRKALSEARAAITPEAPGAQEETL